MKKFTQENVLQIDALEQCECRDTLAMILRHGAPFRFVIDEHKADHDGALPSIDVLLWRASEIARHDIRMEV